MRSIGQELLLELCGFLCEAQSGAEFFVLDLQFLGRFKEPLLRLLALRNVPSNSLDADRTSAAVNDPGAHLQEAPDPKLRQYG